MRVSITFHLNLTDAVQLEALAKQEGKSMSAFAKAIVLDALQDPGEQQKPTCLASVPPRQEARLQDSLATLRAIDEVRTPNNALQGVRDTLEAVLDFDDPA